MTFSQVDDDAVSGRSFRVLDRLVIILCAMRALVVMVLAVALTGCGKPTSLMTEADVGRFETWSRTYQQVAVDMLGVSTAMVGNDVRGARERVDALTPRLAAGDKQSAAVANPEVRELLTDYMVKTRRAVDSLAAVVVELEHKRRPGPDLAREVVDANEEMLETDEKIIDRVLEHTPLSMRERVEALVPEQ